MKCLYGSLDEASKRRYAGVEDEKLGTWREEVYNRLISMFRQYLVPRSKRNIIRNKAIR